MKRYPVDVEWVHVLQTLADAHPNEVRGRHVAGIWWRNRLMAVGMNRRKSHTIQQGFGHRSAHLHAEMDAIKNFRKKLPLRELHRATLVVVRIRAGQLANSKPCSGCERALERWGVRRVWWSE
jgi:tRNA(Arg) A34 adenosine deaminase TadA